MNFIPHFTEISRPIEHLQHAIEFYSYSHHKLLLQFRRNIC